MGARGGHRQVRRQHLGQGLAQKGIAGVEHVHLADLLQPQPRLAVEALSAGTQLRLHAGLLLRPVAAQAPHVGIGREVPPGMAQPGIGALEQGIAGQGGGEGWWIHVDNPGSLIPALLPEGEGLG